nr:MAG TPA: hypothetical protein [Caudoviricetes sp.]
MKSLHKVLISKVVNFPDFFLLSYETLEIPSFSATSEFVNPFRACSASKFLNKFFLLSALLFA